MRLPNGYGSVYKLSGKRRKPYIVVVTLGYELVDGKAKRKTKTVGYYATRKEGLDALADYNRDPLKETDITLGEIYERWSKEAYKDLSESSVYRNTHAWEKIKSNKDKVFKDLKTVDIEKMISVADKPVLKNSIRTMLNGMYKYAMRYDLVNTNYASRIVVSKPKSQIVRIPFTTEEISVLWANTDSKTVCTILAQLYSGMRASEILECEINKEDLTFKGGLKTEAGRRTVPVHSRLIPLLDNILKCPYSQYNHEFNKVMKKLKMNHTTHDCRVTFVSRLDGVINDTSLKKLVGHKTQDVTKDIYTKKTIEQLRECIEMLEYC